MDTLMKGRSVSVVLSDGATESVNVRQLPLGEYRKAMLVSDDEFKLVTFICGKHDSWIDKVNPESYETLRAVVQEVNEKGFFVYKARQDGINIARINQLSPQAAEAAAKVGAASLSQNSSPGSVPRPT
jgi:hypothetical protein